MWSLKRAVASGDDDLGDPSRFAESPPSDVMSWLDDGVDAPTVAGLLRQVIDPEVGINIVDLGLVYDVRVSSDRIAVVTISLTTPGCPLSGYMQDSIHRVLWGTPGIEDINVRIVWDPPWSPAMMSLQAKRDLGWAA